MEIEVKERLLSQLDYNKAREHLGARPVEVEQQENVFFDGVDGQFSQSRSSLRLRFITDGCGGAPRCLLTIKEGSGISGGVGVARETQEFVDPDAAHRCCNDSSSTAEIAKLSQIAADALQRHGIAPEQLRKTGSFTTLREAYPFVVTGPGNQLVLELDRTDFGFAVAWECEIEAPSQDIAQLVRAQLCALLDTAGAIHSPSKKTKLACFYTRSVE